jgi:ATPase subunit of ABC transporter with duplicated ATPase domains
MINIKKLELEIGNRKIFSNVSFGIAPGDKVGLIGDNGVGKSSLLKAISGEIPYSKGNIIKPKGIEISLMPQDLNKLLDKTVYDFIAEFTGVKETQEKFNAICQSLSKHSNPKQLLIYEDIFNKYQHLGVADFEKRLYESLHHAGLKDISPNAYIGELSGGQKTRVALSAVLASKQDLILLDEPTNNLDHEGVIVLEKFINRSKASFIIVSHDSIFLNNSINRIIELMGGDKGVKKYSCRYDEYIQIKNKTHESEVRQYTERVNEIKKIERKIQEKKHELQDKGRKRKDNAKLNNNFKSEKASRKKSQILNSLKTRYEKVEEIYKPEDFPSLDFEFNEKGKINPNAQLINIQNLVIEYPNKKIGPISLCIYGNERVLLVGQNGIGKTSIIKAIMNQNKFIKEGKIRLNPSMNISYIDQIQSLPLPDNNAIENLSSLSKNIPINEIIHLLIKFNINKDIMYNKVINLSGGERTKIILASAMANHSNIIILDEPTNNLDSITITALKKALLPYKGALLIVSHNKEFAEDLNINRDIVIN